jgi:hypothetical protein
VNPYGNACSGHAEGHRDEGPIQVGAKEHHADGQGG